MSDWRTSQAPYQQRSRLPEDDLPEIDWGEAAFTPGGGPMSEITHRTKSSYTLGCRWAIRHSGTEGGHKIGHSRARAASAIPVTY